MDRARTKTSHWVFLLLAVVPLATAAAGLKNRIDAVLNDKRLEEAKIGVCVVARGTGRLIYAHRAMVPHIPASNQKIITAAAALEELGTSYRFSTGLWLRGRLDDTGRLTGDLLLRGGGDPTLGSREFAKHIESENWTGGPPANLRSWARRLAGTGLRRVTGEIIVDDTFFDRKHVHPDWPRRQLWRYYCAPSAGLVYQDSCIGVNVRPAEAVGEPAHVLLDPPVRGIEVANSCTTRPKRHVIWFERKPGSGLIRVGGSVRHESFGYNGRVTVPQPALFAGRAFAHELKKAGVHLDNPVRLIEGKTDLSDQGWRRMADREVPLQAVLSVMLKESENLYAEQVAKTLGAVDGGQGTWAAGLRCMGKMLRRMHVKPEDFRLADGSGMSRKNRLTPRGICEVLLQMTGRQTGEDLAPLLAAPGEGTLDDRFGGQTYRDRIRAKTGYLYGVGALSGYATSRSGRRVVFSVMINEFSRGGNADMKQIQDRIVREIIERLD